MEKHQENYKEVKDPSLLDWADKNPRKALLAPIIAILGMSGAMSVINNKNEAIASRNQALKCVNQHIPDVGQTISKENREEFKRCFANIEKLF